MGRDGRYTACPGERLGAPLFIWARNDGAFILVLLDLFLNGAERRKIIALSNRRAPMYAAAHGARTIRAPSPFLGRIFPRIAIAFFRPAPV